MLIKDFVERWDGAFWQNRSLMLGKRELRGEITSHARERPRETEIAG